MTESLGVDMSLNKENGAEQQKKNKEKQPKHPGGPLQRSGNAADSWNAALGGSLEVLPQLYLPTNRSLLRRYRFFRMEHEQTPIMELAHAISQEVTYIWNSARIPIIDEENVAKQLKKLIDWWNKSVTNDTAERAVKKITEYANAANNGGQR